MTPKVHYQTSPTEITNFTKLGKFERDKKKSGDVDLNLKRHWLT